MSNYGYVGPFSVPSQMFVYKCPWGPGSDRMFLVSRSLVLSCTKFVPQEIPKFGRTLWFIFVRNYPRGNYRERSLALPPCWDVINPPTAIDINPATLTRILVTPWIFPRRPVCRGYCTINQTL